MRKMLMVSLALLVAACEPTAEQKARARSTLPAGCRILNLGSYGDARALYVVHCDGRTTRTMNYMTPAGKTSVQVTTAWID